MLGGWVGCAAYELVGELESNAILSSVLIWEVPLLIWLEVPLLIWEVPLLILWVGGKMKSRIRLTSAKVGVEVEAELGNIENT